MKKTLQPKKANDLLRELSKDWRINTSILNALAKGDKEMTASITRLCKEKNQGNMLKIGLTLLAFPFPIVVDDVLGWSLITAGLIQRKIKNSALYLEDVNKTLPKIMKELHEIRQDIV